ncbi:hypothetical protein DWB84_11670 [Saccharophagus sp. K07]|jgi:hypothetical protein|uniref:glycosyltransferase n=1 Tax=Saccharophagus sp. K07 TaxID=2283636 RepID=UPI001652B1EC|nr:nucleotide disphospho-sugar-binding domain-containing protein [Saccharophagus sp. K07]MBC6906118.1 hypothetical protein [Saccharophagus sp. K07]
MTSCHKTVLCTWEIGAELGHISRLSAIAKALEAAGYRVVVALKDLSRAYHFFAGTRVQLLQAPVWLPRITMQRPVACLPDALLLMGYLEPEPLACLVQAWQSLATLVRADLIIFDYSPTAMLALRELRIPKILVGTGFAEPIPGLPTADWRFNPLADGLILRQESRVLGVVNQMLEQHGYSPLSCFTEIFSCDRVLITNFRELDLYPNRLNARYCIAPGRVTYPQIKFRSNGRPRIVVYLKPSYPYLPWLLQALANCRAHIFVVSPMGPVAQLRNFASSRFEFTTEVVNLPEMLSRADLFVSHGGAGSALESLVAGVPVLVLPIQGEQLLTGMRIQSLGVGHLMERPTSEQDLEIAINQMLENLEFHRQSIVRLLANYSKPYAACHEEVVKACFELIN